MEVLVIEGGKTLQGEVKISGSKNASLPLMAASLLTEEPVILEDVPNLLDVKIMMEILAELGVKVDYKRGMLKLDSSSLNSTIAPHRLVNKMRASFLVVGPLLGRCGRVKISLPGGCAIGRRPVDLHWKGMAALGGDFTLGRGDVEATCQRFKGTRIYLDYPSVGATENLMMAATLAEGETLLENAALDPEVVDLANLLNRMGGRISGAGTGTIKIQGVDFLQGATFKVIPDRIEAGTYMIAGAMCGNELKLKNVLMEHVKPLAAKLQEAGALVEEEEDCVISISSPTRLQSVDLKTLPYPGFPTDLQPQFTSLLSTARGAGLITETVFDNRFRHVEELLRMGADIKVEDNKLVVRGKESLKGSKVKVSDLRGGAALVLAGLAAEGVTEIRGVHHLDRGYAGLEQKIRQLGGKVHRVNYKEKFRHFLRDTPC